jgi:hypothetical protein
MANAHPPDQIPADWPDQILRRVLFDPDPMGIIYAVKQ